MNRLWHLLRTTIGRKLLVASSGIVLILFVIGHMVGNLTIYFGQAALNSYAHWLQESPVLWLMRLVMLTIVLVHIALGIAVTLENYRARKIPYQAHNAFSKRLFQSRLIISGMVLLLFIVGHVMHLTLGAGVGAVFSLRDNQGYVDVYSRVVSAFQNPWIAWSYICAMLLLALHLKHTVRALFQTMGFYHDNYFSFFEFLSWIVTVLVVAGFITIPLAVQTGWLALPAEAVSTAGFSRLVGS